MSRPHHDGHPPTDAPVPSPPPPSEQRLKQIRQDAQEAALEAQLAQKAGRRR